MGTPYLGEIRLMSFGFVPKGWAQCNGQLMSINQNQALFSLLGTTYGGNGTVNFGLPDLQGRVPIHRGNGFTQGERAGQEAHTLIQSELPAHNHAVVVSSETATGIVPTGNLLGNSGTAMYGAATNLVAMHPSSMTNAGGSQPHTNMQPYSVVNFCIALQGIFPSRN